jgi:hypothetical protein
MKLQVLRLVSCIVAGGVPAAAQCAMCRTALAAQHGGADVFNKAILVLILPAFVLFSGTFALIFTRRGKPEE